MMLKRRMPNYYVKASIMRAAEIGAGPKQEKLPPKITPEGRDLTSAGFTNHAGYYEDPIAPIARNADADPEKNLVAKLVLRTLADLQIQIGEDRPGKVDPNDRYDAYHWVFGEPQRSRRGELFTFEYICEALSINVRAARNAIRGLIPETFELPERRVNAWIDSRGLRHYASRKIR